MSFEAARGNDHWRAAWSARLLAAFFALAIAIDVTGAGRLLSASTPTAAEAGRFDLLLLLAALTALLAVTLRRNARLIDVRPSSSLPLEVEELISARARRAAIKGASEQHSRSRTMIRLKAQVARWKQGAPSDANWTSIEEERRSQASAGRLSRFPSTTPDPWSSILEEAEKQEKKTRFGRRRNG